MARRRTGGRTRAALFLTVSVVAAGAFTAVIYRLIQGYQEALVEAEMQEEVREVVVAARTLHQGQTLTEGDLALIEIPPAFVPETTFQFKEDVIGRVPRERILPGEFVREERLADPESGVGLNAIIPRGMRAVSINITDGSAVSGFLNPGNYVDVLVTLKGTDGKRKTVTLIQACYVLAVDARMGDDEGGARRTEQRIRPSVTLAVTPEQAEQLAHSQIEGDVTLTLRNDIDVTKVETHGATAAVLIGYEGHTAIPVSRLKAPPKESGTGAGNTKTRLDIIRGSKTEKKTFE